MAIISPGLVLPFLITAMAQLSLPEDRPACHIIGNPSYDQYCQTDAVPSTTCNTQCMTGPKLGMQVCCTAQCCGGPAPTACGKKGADCGFSADPPCCSGLQCQDHFCLAGPPPPGPAPACFGDPCSSASDCCANTYCCDKSSFACSPDQQCLCGQDGRDPSGSGWQDLCDDEHPCCPGTKCVKGGKAWPNEKVCAKGHVGPCSQAGGPCGPGHGNQTCCAGLTCEGGYYGQCAQKEKTRGGLPHLLATTVKPTFSVAQVSTHVAATRSATTNSSKRGVRYALRSGPRVSQEIIGFEQACDGCCLSATSASLYQFYTGVQKPSEQLQCDILTLCGPQLGCATGAMPCMKIPPTGCPDPEWSSGISYYEATAALGYLTKKSFPNSCSCASTLSCGGQIDPCPDASGNTFWFAGYNLVQERLDKVLSSGNPVIMISQNAGEQVHSTLIAEKNADGTYHLWDPSSTYNPPMTWQDVSFSVLNAYVPPGRQGGQDPFIWKQAVWGGINPC